METHPEPAKALSDGPNMLPLSVMEEMLTVLAELDQVTRAHRFLEDTLV